MTRLLDLPDFPVKETFPALKSALQNNTCAILEAPPGAGKTTLVPLTLLGEDWLSDQKIIMLEPRRLAAKMAAARMASLLGEKVGQTVGYRIRQEKQVSAHTRIEVVTEGILTRLIQNDPELNGVGLVIFDEFHERNLQGDLGLAFCLETQEALREDLRVLVMSATLDGDALQTFLKGAPRITSEGRSYPVETRHLPRPEKFDLARDTASAIKQAFREEGGNILAFLPGEGEIRKTQSILQDSFGGRDDVLLAPLYGALPPKQQDLAIAPTKAGVRKIVLATTIAETSLTIEGIRVVVDCGQKRVARFDPARGLSKLETVRVSKASAEQRKGRAGRMEAGVCYQLWPKAETQALQDRDRPEILEADLAPFVLELAAWGVQDITDLRLLDTPPERSLADARALLQELDALDKDFRLTAHGRQMQSLSLHPRLAHMVLTAQQHSDEDAALACHIAAILHDGPILKGKAGSDLRDSLRLLTDGKPDPQTAKGPFHRARETAKTLKARLKLSKVQASNAAETGALLALAFPDRIAKSRGKNSPDYLLQNGMGACLEDDSRLLGEDYLVVTHLDGSRAKGRIFSAAPLSEQDIRSAYHTHIQVQNVVEWDQKSQSARAEKQERFGAIVFKATQLSDIDPDLIKQALCQGVRKNGLHTLNWTEEAKSLCQRIRFLRHYSDHWPDFSDEALLETLEDWFSPFIGTASRLEHLKKIDLHAALLARLTWEDQQQMEKLAPTHYRVPSGSNIRLDYSSVKKPVLAVKLQEMFGHPDTPSIHNGDCKLSIHLLSPAGRPLQITENLASFWQTAYDSVKKEMKGRYPKHPWPDDPLTAQATNKTKRHLQ
ncbi:ATP-dependent helicase HrpB [Terasakiella pusilla]|uniref:ATP-dependent helicase HrpB n=1 Tax=Terasakiella pusilla TaxID=64973 RepID=UPI003AA7C8E3